jgi:hypothetical protein
VQVNILKIIKPEISKRILEKTMVFKIGIFDLKVSEI